LSPAGWATPTSCQSSLILKWCPSI